MTFQLAKDYSLDFDDHLTNYRILCDVFTGKAIGATPGEYKDFLYEPNVSLDANGTLHFKKVSKDAQGHFLCEAKNNIGTGVSKVIFLKVNGNFIHFQTLVIQRRLYFIFIL